MSTAFRDVIINLYVDATRSIPHVTTDVRESVERFNATRRSLGERVHVRSLEPAPELSSDSQPVYRVVFDVLIEYQDPSAATERFAVAIDELQRTLETLPGIGAFSSVEHSTPVQVIADDILQSPSFQILVDPGDAGPELIAEVLHAINDLHRAAGGHGLNFSTDGEEIVVTDEEHV